MPMILGRPSDVTYKPTPNPPCYSTRTAIPASILQALVYLKTRSTRIDASVEDRYHGASSVERLAILPQKLLSLRLDVRLQAFHREQLLLRHSRYEENDDEQRLLRARRDV